MHRPCIRSTSPAATGRQAALQRSPRSSDPAAQLGELARSTLNGAQKAGYF